MLITVWTKSRCVQCDQSKKLMDKLGIPYEELSLEEHPDALAAFIEAGHTSAPIVVTDIKVWSGFRMEKIKSLANYLNSQESKGKL